MDSKTKLQIKPQYQKDLQYVLKHKNQTLIFYNSFCL